MGHQNQFTGINRVTSSASDPCIYAFTDTDDIRTSDSQGKSVTTALRGREVEALLTFYVGDVLPAGGDMAVRGVLRGKLMARFEITYMKDVSFVLGMNGSTSRSQEWRAHVQPG